MNRQFKAAGELHQFFTREKIPYAIIGGIALQHWGEPRLTLDVDATVLVPGKEEERVLKKIFAVFPPRVNNAWDIALQNRVCLVVNQEGCDLDISLGVPGYEEEVMKRAVECNLGVGIKVRICSAEDLIIHKAVAGRPQDLMDITSVIHRQGNKLDINYLRHWLQQFSLLLEKEEILEYFEKPWRAFKP